MFNRNFVRRRFFQIIAPLLIIFTWLLGHYISNDPLQLTIIHTDVLYGRIEPQVATVGPFREQYIGGSAMMSSQINRIRDEVKLQSGYSVLVDAGNTIFGGTSTRIGQGETVLKIMNEMKYDAMTTGNSEYDFGVEGLKGVLSLAKFPVLGANIIDIQTKTVPTFLKPYTIKDLGTMKVGILGLANPNMHKICLPEKLIGLRFQAVERAAEKYVKELKTQGADFIVILSDIWDMRIEQELAKKFQNDIHLIVSSTKHDENYYQPIYVGEIPIVKTPRNLKSVGRFDVLIDRNSKRVLSRNWKLYPLISSKVLPDSSIQEIVSEETQYLEEKVLEKAIGLSSVKMAYETRKEGAFGNFVADIVMDKVRPDIVLLNSGNLRGLPEGRITKEALSRAIPYENKVLTLTLKGQDIKLLLEKSFQLMYYVGILQVSGIRLTYDLQRPFGDRVSNIYVGSQPLDMEKEYTVATIEFLRIGGDGFDTFKKGTNVQLHGELKKMVSDHIQEKYYITGRIDGRMTRIDSSDSLQGVEKVTPSFSVTTH